MSDFPNKILSAFLAFLLLVVAPLLIIYVASEFKSQRQVFNEVTQFIDKVTDKASITEEDKDDLYIGVNATGGTYDVVIRRYIKTPVPEDEGESRTVYLNKELDEEGQMELGDLVKVQVVEVGVSPAKRILWSLLGIDTPKTEFNLTGSVR